MGENVLGSEVANCNSATLLGGLGIPQFVMGQNYGPIRNAWRVVDYFTQWSSPKHSNLHLMIRGSSS